MTNKEKTDAIEVVKQMVIDGQVSQEVVEKYFPELKDSDGEKTRKGIISCIMGNMPDNECRKKYIDWLDAHAEQKSIYQKFRVGDKVKNGYLTYTVEGIDEDSYKLKVYSKDGHKGCTKYLTIGCEKGYELIEQKPATMSLDEAIKHCREKSFGNNACALEHKQLEKWLIELKELKEQKGE